MSYDFALQKRCSHEILFEQAEIDAPSGRVFFQKQPANAQSVNVYVDGVQIPSSGLYSFAELPFRNSEPYRIQAGVNDVLYLGIGNNVPRFVQLLTGPNLKAAELAADLQRKVPELSISVANNRVVFRSRTRYDGAAFQFPDPRWTDRIQSSTMTARVLNAYKHVGIVPGRVSSGRKILPGWSFIQDLDSPITTDRAIQFDSPLSNSNPLIQISYTTIAQLCRRCFGSRIEFDYSIVDGTYETIRDTDLLAQEFDKFLFTRLGSHWKWSWIGSRLIDRVGGKANATRSVGPALISIDISQAYKVYQNIKNQQEQRFPFQNVSDAEMPSSLDSIDVQNLPDDPTTAIVSISIRNRSRVPVPLQRVLGEVSPFTLFDGSGGPPFLPRG